MNTTVKRSLLIAGGTLLLLKLMQRRSSSDRSWVAHLGLLAILLLPVGAIVLPALNVAGPAFLTSDEVPPAITSAPSPNLDVTAAPEVRALRRQQELKAKGEDHPLSQILAQIQARDKADSERKIAPLRQADDAVLLDTTDMDADACLAAALALARERGL